MSENRRRILSDVLNFSYSWPVLAERLRSVPVSQDLPLVVVSPEHVVATLNKFLGGELTALDVEEWANILEMREDIGCSGDTKEAVWELANPLLTQALNESGARRIISRLRR